MKKKSLFKSLIALALVVTSIPVTNANAVTLNLEGDYVKATESIVYQRHDDKNGATTDVVLAQNDDLKAMIDQRAEAKGYKTPVVGTIDETAQTVTLNIQLKDVYLDNSGYKNGASGPGESLLNLIEFYADVLQTKQLMNSSSVENYKFVDSKGAEVDAQFIDTMIQLLDDVYNLRTTTDLRLRKDSIQGLGSYNENDLYGGVDVDVYDNGTKYFTLHMDHHGFWGYELAGDTFIDKVVGVEVTDKMTLRNINTLYAEFMQIEMPKTRATDATFKWYILNNTDLENPFMYVGYKDGDPTKAKEVLMIDVDFYGANVLNDVIKSTIKEGYGLDHNTTDTELEAFLGEDFTFYLYLTHKHGDHVNNLAVINEDALLRKYAKVIYPAREPQPGLDSANVDNLITLFGEPILLADDELIEVCGHEFKLLEIPDQHTEFGSGMADITMGILYSGDTLGSQIHLGGTSVSTSNGKLSDGWVNSMVKTLEFIDENNISYILTGHSPYHITPEYVESMGAAVKYIDEQLKVNPLFAGLVVAKNGEVINDTELYGQIFATGLTDKEVFDYGSINFSNRTPYDEEGDYAKALELIEYYRTEADGSKENVGITDEVKEMVDQRVEMGKPYKTNVKAVVNPGSRTLTLDIPLVDVYLDNSEYKNGASLPGESYFRLLEFYADALQVKAISDKYKNHKIIDANGKEVNNAYISELVELLDRVWNFDPTTDLRYRQASIEFEDGYNPLDLYGGVDVELYDDAGETKYLTFHMDHHGFWGYELAGDTFMNKVVGVEVTDKMTLRDINTFYGNFMQVKLPELERKEGNFDWYILNNTDLENPFMYVGTNSEGENEALLIDVDFYGENVINDVIKATIAETLGSVEKLDTLYIYLTHLHLDHVNNLHMINQDELLRDKVKIIWPVAEEHPTLDGRDLITLFDFEDEEGTTPRESVVINLEDGDQIEILDHTFELLSVPDQHSNGGSGLVDTTMGVYYSGDTLGSQIHLGGTSIFSATGKLTQGWLDSMGHTVSVMEKYDIRYILTGHSPYPINVDYAKWMGAAIEYIDEQLKLNPQFSGLVVVENGEVINGTERFGEIFATGLTDKEVFDFASVNFMNMYKPEQQPSQPLPPTSTGDSHNIVLWATCALLAVGGYVLVMRKKEEV